MTIGFTPGPFTQAMFGTQQRGMLDAVFDRFLSVELDEGLMDAQKIEEFATKVATSVSDHFDEFSDALPLPERQNIERIAASQGTGLKATTIEYLSNAYLFRSVRDYFGLPPQEVFPQLDAGGFLAFTSNGSIIASPPEHDPGDRTFHYTRMPSRTNSIQTGSRNGSLLKDIVLGHRLRATVYTTSPVQRLLYVPTDQAPLFEAIHDASIAAGLSISRIFTRDH